MFPHEGGIGSEDFFTYTINIIKELRPATTYVSLTNAHVIIIIIIILKTTLSPVTLQGFCVYVAGFRHHIGPNVTPGHWHGDTRGSDSAVRCRQHLLMCTEFSSLYWRDQPQLMVIKPVGFSSWPGVSGWFTWQEFSCVKSQHGGLTQQLVAMTTRLSQHPSSKSQI